MGASFGNWAASVTPLVLRARLPTGLPFRFLAAPTTAAAGGCDALLRALAVVGALPLSLAAAEAPFHQRVDPAERAGSPTFVIVGLLRHDDGVVARDGMLRPMLARIRSILGCAEPSALWIVEFAVWRPDGAPDAAIHCAFRKAARVCSRMRCSCSGAS